MVLLSHFVVSVPAVFVAECHAFTLQPGQLQWKLFTSDEMIGTFAATHCVS